MAEHSFLARTRISKKQTCRQWSDDFIYSTPALSVSFFSIIERSVLMALVFYYKDLLDKGNDAKNPAIPSFCNQLNATHAQLLKKLRPIAFAETCRFLTIQSLEFQEIWQKIK